MVYDCHHQTYEGFDKERLKQLVKELHNPIVLSVESFPLVKEIMKTGEAVLSQDLRHFWRSICIRVWHRRRRQSYRKKYKMYLVGRVFIMQSKKQNLEKNRRTSLAVYMTVITLTKCRASFRCGLSADVGSKFIRCFSRAGSTYYRASV